MPARTGNAPASPEHEQFRASAAGIAQGRGGKLAAVTLRIRIAGEWPEAARAGEWTLELDSAAAAPEGRRLAAWQRLLRERRAARGWDEIAAARALQAPGIRAIAALLNRDCDAALLALPETECRPALALLEPQGSGRAAVPAHFATPAGEDFTAPRAAASYAWLSPPRAATVGEIADTLASAAAWMGARAGCAATAVVVQFAAGKNPAARQARAVGEHVKSRAQAAQVEIYSGLFYRHGQLEASRLLSAIRAALPSGAQASLPVCWSPQLDLAALGHGLNEEGGGWSGAILAGAEAVAAMLPPPT